MCLARTFTFCSVALLLLSTSLASYGESSNPSDSTTRNVLVITPRLNSTGHFPFTGSLINHHLNADINVFYDSKYFGFFIFKSHDLQETHSIVNYLQPGIFANIPLSSTLKLRTFFGYLFSQANGFKDSDSDYYTAATLYWTIGNGFRLENTALFYDLNLGTKLAERLLFVWEKGKFRADLYFWHRLVLEKNNHATSGMLGITFPPINLSDNVSLLFTSSYQQYLTTNKPGYALRNGFLFSLAMPISK